jgi:hypothetical protein
MHGPGDGIMPVEKKNTEHSENPKIAILVAK